MIHLEPLDMVVKVSKGASFSEVKDVFKKELKIDLKESKAKKAAKRPVKQRKKKAMPVKEAPKKAVKKEAAPKEQKAEEKKAETKKPEVKHEVKSVPKKEAVTEKKK